MVSSALVSTEGGPIPQTSGVLPSNLSHSVDRARHTKRFLKDM